MNDARKARSAFDAGLASWTASATGEALRRFGEATELDADMCDAWFARFALGDRHRSVSSQIVATGARYDQEFRRVGFDPATFGARVDLDELVSYTFHSLADAWLIEACLLTAEARPKQAVVLMESVASPPTPWLYAAGLAYLSAQRWDKALSAFSPVTRGDDAALAEAAQLQAGIALGGLGLFHEAASRLDAATDSSIHAIGVRARFYRALVSRREGDEVDAQRRLQSAFAADSSLPMIVEAMNDASYGFLVQTPEDLASRTDPWDPSTSRHASDLDANLQKDRTDELESALAELDGQIGMSGVKSQVRAMVAQMRANKLREARGYEVRQRPRHLVFQGPPGTGKTTVARLMGRIFFALGALSSRTVVETDRADFVGAHLGSTAIKANATIDRALDGVLFIDEAYALSNGGGIEGGDAFGREAVSTLLARMENDRDRLVVIIAGYKDEIDSFLVTNPGLDSRFATRVDFESYSAGELAEICRSVGDENLCPLTPEALEVFAERVSRVDPVLLDRLGNARFARECVFAASDLRDLRIGSLDERSLSALPDEALLAIEADDVAAAIDSRLASL